MQKMITILGPTASGKTPVAAHLAAEIGGEVISADSRQVYRRMDIGTGKDLEDYIVKEQGAGGKEQAIPYHLIDIAEPGTKYNLFQYQQDFFDAYEAIRSRGAVPILCGGTGLYIEAVLKGYHLSPVPQNQELRDALEGKSLDELTQMLTALKEKTGSNMHNKTDVDSCQRAIRAIEIETYNLANPTPKRELPPVESVIIGIDIDRELRREIGRIDDIFDFPWGRSKVDPNVPYDMLNQAFSRTIFYQYGLLNDCHRRCLEDGVEFGWSVESLQYLARCAFLSREFPAAIKVLNLLSHTMFYKDWGDNIQKLLTDTRLFH